MSIKRLLVAGFAGTIVFFAGGSMASAHATIPSGDLKADGYGAITIRIPHGCEGLPTNIVEVQIPEGFTGLKPEAKAGWNVETEMVETEPYEMYGQTMTERIGIVRWTGGNLADNQYEDFGISLKAPNTPDVTVAFPTVQYCGDASVAWNEVAAEGQDPHDLEKPAPTVNIVAAGGHGASEEMTGMPMIDTAQVESLQATVTALETKIADLESSQTQVTETADESEQKDSESSPLGVIALISSLAALGVGVAALRKR